MVFLLGWIMECTKINNMSKQIKWKSKTRLNCWEGTLKGETEPVFFIEGLLCLTDIREIIRPNFGDSCHYYKIDTIEEAKELAEDLLNGNNKEKHEANRLKWVAEQEATAKLIQETDELLKSLRK